MPSLIALVEGPGDVAAVPLLLRKLLHTALNGSLTKPLDRLVAHADRRRGLRHRHGGRGGLGDCLSLEPCQASVQAGPPGGPYSATRCATSALTRHGRRPLAGSPRAC
jgi:hypothetical protein